MSTMRGMYRDIQLFYKVMRKCYPKWSAKELKQQMSRKIYSDALMALGDALDEEYRSEFGIEPEDGSG